MPDAPQASCKRRSPTRGHHPRGRPAKGADSASQPCAVLAPNNPPIDDPQHEKKLIEKAGSVAYGHYLREKAGASVLWENPVALAERISEVYRLCSEDGKRLDVVEDLVAFHPGPAFHAPWLAKLIEQESITLQHGAAWGNPNRRNALFQVLERGFGRAAKPATRIRRSLKIGRLEAARTMQHTVQRDLDAFVKSLDLRRLKAEGGVDRVTTLLSDKVTEVINQSPSVLASVTEKLGALLRQSRTYDASVLVASRVCAVSPRALERKPFR